MADDHMHEFPEKPKPADDEPGSSGAAGAPELNSEHYYRAYDARMVLVHASDHWQICRWLNIAYDSVTAEDIARAISTEYMAALCAADAMRSGQSVEVMSLQLGNFNKAAKIGTQLREAQHKLREAARPSLRLRDATPHAAIGHTKSLPIGEAAADPQTDTGETGETDVTGETKHGQSERPQCSAHDAQPAVRRTHARRH